LGLDRMLPGSMAACPPRISTVTSGLRARGRVRSRHRRPATRCPL